MNVMVAAVVQPWYGFGDRAAKAFSFASFGQAFDSKRSITTMPGTRSWTHCRQCGAFELEKFPLKARKENINRYIGHKYICTT